MDKYGTSLIATNKKKLKVLCDLIISHILPRQGQNKIKMQ